MRVQRPPTLLLVVGLTLLALAYSKPLYVPEHCQNYSGRMLRACIRTAQTDTVGLYTNLVIQTGTATFESAVPVDRGSPSTHADTYELNTSVTLFDVGYSVN
ncbi:ORF3 protein [Bat coronavirus]|uniref:ORF3 protein n=1 Tax=Bat coronavirus TaxID=1508220 RepID=UPI000A17F4B1|nr:ORF3 protein [Bat coronavirus]ARJ34227.1 ORF3 protein [Bat coronavirus]